VTKRRIAVGGVPLYVADDGDGPPVLLMHGMGLDHRMWDPQVEVLVASG
jgi:pimeloyl-ACP methyl ester carboxylesterase